MDGTETTRVAIPFLSSVALAAMAISTSEPEAKITALACSEAPDGYAQWSLRLLADRLVELEMVETISYCSVGLILKKMNYSLTENVNGAFQR